MNSAFGLSAGSYQRPYALTPPAMAAKEDVQGRRSPAIIPSLAVQTAEGVDGSPAPAMTKEIALRSRACSQQQLVTKTSNAGG